MDRIVIKISHSFFFFFFLLCESFNDEEIHNKLNIFVDPIVFPRGVKATCKFRKVALFARPVIAYGSLARVDRSIGVQQLGISLQQSRWKHYVSYPRLVTLANNSS